MRASARHQRAATPAAASAARAPSAARDAKHAVHDLLELAFAGARSPRQRERVLRAAGASLTGASLNALGIVRRHAPIALTDLASRLEVDQSTVSRQVNRLERLGLVRRTIDPADRRIARLAPTAKGTRLLDRVREVSLDDFEAVLGAWPASDRARFAELLDRFREGLLAGRVDESGWSVHAAGTQRRNERTRTR